MKPDTEVIIVGAGIGGLTLALSLHQAGISCRVFEAVPELRPLGVGINLMPHASKELGELGLLPELDKVGVQAMESVFFTQHGQLIYREPAGAALGYPWPQYSIHRGDLQTVLLEAVRQRLGPDRVVCGHRCIGLQQHQDTVTVSFVDPDGMSLEPITGRIAVGCDGIHSALRRKLYPDEGSPRYSGVNMWRGTVCWDPILNGSSMIRAGWLSVGKMVIYPIRNGLTPNGKQLINWVAELECPQPAERDWGRPGRLEDFLPAFSEWKFDWLDVPALIQASESILEYPMCDQDPLPTWTDGRMTLLGDAAHPMVPRGSNGAGQAIIDARFLAGELKRLGLTPEALLSYDKERVAATTRVVLTNRSNPPDAILREVFERSKGRPFKQIEDLISHSELRAIADNYRKVAGFDTQSLLTRSSYV
ncbi:flavin-dependent oxidoreductase [Pusillimonas sp.]|uniref:flavin-dependent oxidoreductase n=1 Tax=Pusillimonas sp. TaxID=3040095 RepID=UPI0029A0332D|nr:flavin-dependent oxidoreductase [Pusillimonas sp.]MDX3894972.1 flavin-dependent oxidoreductase [Pusillimonas sp.]